jgi:hypothetical protein
MVQFGVVKKYLLLETHENATVVTTHDEGQ